MGLAACAMTGLLISPVSWPFHWVWCVPALILWARRAWREDRTGEKGGVVAACLALAATTYWTTTQFFYWSVPTPLYVLFANLFAPMAILMLVAVAVYLRGEAARSGTDFRADVIRPILAGRQRLTRSRRS
jgi:alpha-1,2-mannosyltransferase